MYELELHKKYNLQFPAGTVSMAAIKEARHYIMSWSCYVPPIYPKYFPLYWTVDNQPKLPKRLLEYCKISFYNVPDDKYQKLCEILAKGKITLSSLNIEITNALDWKMGEFSDENSCYWREHQTVQDLLVDNSFRAVKCYNGEQPMGRFLALPAGNDFVCFNNYGLEWHMVSEIVQGLGYETKEVNLSNNGKETGLLYINRGKGLYCTKSLEALLKESYDFKIDERSYRSVTCADCGEEITISDVGGFTKYNEPLCYDCS